MEKTKLKRLIVLVSIIIIVIIFLSILLNQTTYAVLYTDMNPEDAGEVLGVLAEMGVDAKVRGADTILVNENQVETLRMQLAAEGYPSSGINYEIFQNAAGLGVTDMEKQVYYEFQLQYNIQKTIEKLDKVKSAVVNINLAEESSFVLSDNETPASAAVVLTLERNATLSSDEVQAIAELVSKSVPKLSADDVRIVDSQMHLYSVSGASGVGSISDQMDLQAEVQSRLQKQVFNLLTPIFGENNILAEVHVQLGFDDVAVESIELNPEEDGKGIAISMKEIAEVINNGEGADANDTSGTTQYMTTDEAQANADYYTKTSEANYEISQTKTIIENAKGKVEDLSVAIIINMDYSDEEYQEKVKNLIANAIGVDAERISVEMFSFIDIDSKDSDLLAMPVTQQDIMDDIQSESTLRLILILVAIVVVMVIILSIVRMFVSPSYSTVDAEGYYDGIEYLADEEITPEMMNATADTPTYSADMQSKDKNMVMLEDYIEKDPETIANLLRNWLNEE